MARNKFDIDEILTRDETVDMKHLIRILKYMKPYSGQMVSTLIMLLVSSFLGLLTPIFFKMIIDDFIPNKNYAGIAVTSGAYLIILILGTVFLKIRVIAMSKVGQSIIRDLRFDLFAHMQELPFAYYDSRPHGKILVRVVNYINSLSDLLSNGFLNLCTNLFTLAVIVIMMLYLDARLTLVSVAGLPILLLTIYFIRTRSRKAWQLQSVKQSNLNAYLHESIAGMKITQIFTREKYNLSTLDRVQESVSKTWMKACRIMFLMTPSVENISIWTTSLFYFCAMLWLTGSSTAISVGLVVAFASYISQFWQPISGIAQVYNNLVVNMAYLERIFETLDEPVIVKDKENAGVMPTIEGKVTFEDVTFSYDPDRPILKNVSFECNPGDGIALVGPTGAGKTTIVNLLSRFYDIDSGSIQIDGVDISGVTLKSLRSQMGIMLQDSFIFSGTVMDNIRYSRLDATDEQIIAAAKTVQAHDFIMAMENGYQTEVNERGSRLSAGQRQLISFARALLADPKILILDEATSSIDTKTEKAMQEGLNRLLAGRTSFIIAHRLSTIKNSTKIMYIDDGRIVEAGTHDELIAKRGAYYELNKAQYTVMMNA